MHNCCLCHRPLAGSFETDDLKITHERRWIGPSKNQDERRWIGPSKNQDHEVHYEEVSEWVHRACLERAERLLNYQTTGAGHD